ncbi:MAG: cobalt ECF transporter T component CbiQ [Lentisphaerae bacterium RIFOXYA12_FULL_48_11]|nr:MAG: cobalt ECF transporter T component CbiQ [Lentisphaerae bacterium RIFOXYA12_FULL_48_11]
MSCVLFSSGSSHIHRLDPRVRFVVTLILAFIIAVADNLMTLVWALALAALFVVFARLAVYPVIRRLSHLNAFMFFLWLVLPWSVQGDTALVLAGIPCTAEGLRLAMTITLKGNAIVLLFTALVATIDPAHLGYTLKHLALPDKLVHLFLLVIRYTDVIHEEYERIRNAMKARAFKASFCGHTLMTFGYLVGLLLIRSIDRSERVLGAMKCRGFDGRFRILKNLTLKIPDLLFVTVALCHACVWIWMEF